MPQLNQQRNEPFLRQLAEALSFWTWDSEIERELTLLGLYNVVLVADFRVQNVFDLVVNLLGFGLLNKNITIMGLQEWKWNFANPKFLVLKWKAELDVRLNRPKASC